MPQPCQSHRAEEGQQLLYRAEVNRSWASAPSQHADTKAASAPVPGKRIVGEKAPWRQRLVQLAAQGQQICSEGGQGSQWLPPELQSRSYPDRLVGPSRTHLHVSCQVSQDRCMSHRLPTAAAHHDDLMHTALISCCIHLHDAAALQRHTSRQQEARQGTPGHAHKGGCSCRCRLSQIPKGPHESPSAAAA